MARSGDRFTVSTDGDGVVAVYGRGHWDVMGPRVVRGGRVDHKQQEHYGYVRDDGAIHNFGGKGAAGRHHLTYLEIARDKLAGGLGGVGHVTPGPAPRSMAEPTAMTSGILTVSNKPYPRAETIRRLEAAGIAASVMRSPIAGTVVLKIDPQRGHEAFRIKEAVEREWLDAKHGRGGKVRLARAGKRVAWRESRFGWDALLLDAQGHAVNAINYGLKSKPTAAQRRDAERQLLGGAGGKARRGGKPRAVRGGLADAVLKLVK